MPPNPKWVWPQEEIRRIGYQVIDLIAHYLTSLPNGPVFQPFPRELAANYLNSSAPKAGESAENILEDFAREIVRFPFGNGHPRFYGWVNSPPAVISVFAEALAAAMNPSCAGGNHAAIYVEREVINWFKQIVSFPANSMGLLVSGGSMAALTALATARYAKCSFDVRKEGLQGAHRRLIFYRSGEGHACHQKAIELMGIGHENLRIVPHDSALRMDPSALEAAMVEDRQRGDLPVAVIASAGTVNTGTIDPLDAISDVCARHGVWLHVDAAYGGPAILTTKYREQLSGLARADSLTLDPHKWMYIPVEAGLVLVRDAEALRRAFSLVPSYLRTDGRTEGVGGLPWYSEYGFQQTRGFRALKVWMALRYHGVEGYSSSIERDISLAELLRDSLRNDRDFEVFEPQSLSIVCFRFVPQNFGHHLDAVDVLNKAILEKVQLGGEAFLSSTVIDGKFWLRACVINPYAEEEDIRRTFEAVKLNAVSSLKG